MALNDKINDLETNNIQEIKINNKLAHERGLYRDLANAIPSGMYRLRVCHKEGIREEKWSSMKDAPYRIEFVNDRFFEILDLDKENFLNNPGILNNISRFPTPLTQEHCFIRKKRKNLLVPLLSENT